MHIVCEYKNNLLTSLFCHTFDNRDKHKLQRKNCRSYFLNITMKKNGKNEELQSRREFFKRAAKGALPILAGAALLSSPILSETANAMSCAGCNNRCMNSCFNTCHGTCSRTCSGTYK